MEVRPFEDIREKQRTFTSSEMIFTQTTGQSIVAQGERTKVGKAGDMLQKAV